MQRTHSFEFLWKRTSTTEPCFVFSYENKLFQVFNTAQKINNVRFLTALQLGLHCKLFHEWVTVAHNILFAEDLVKSFRFRPASCVATAAGMIPSDLRKHRFPEENFKLGRNMRCCLSATGCKHNPSEGLGCPSPALWSSLPPLVRNELTMWSYVAVSFHSCIAGIYFK